MLYCRCDGSLPLEGTRFHLKSPEGPTNSDERVPDGSMLLRQLLMGGLKRSETERASW